ncbi:WVD2 family protein, partial [Klebsiella pneumoniae]|uniref:WVD2 family protein n=1 Tax=Klebsiella pneumoniae TaxID=573 RepID=UPI003013BF85
MKQSASVFNFKSDQRAERSKEYFIKLEEKMHAKEAEMNQIQAKTQEKTDAEIKQLRKSLNFKATP